MSKSTGKTIVSIAGLFFGAFNPTAFGFAAGVNWAAGVMGASLFSNIWAATHVPSPETQTYKFDALQNTANADARIPIIYGMRKWGGYQTWHSVGKDKKVLTKDIVLCEGEIDSISSVKANNMDIGSIGGCSYTSYLGSPNQSPPDNYDTVGGYKNCAWLRAVLTSSDKLQGSNPTITCIVKGIKVYDTRNHSAAYSENPAMCLRDYILNARYGLGRWITAEMLDEDSFKECADYCDEVIAYYVPNTLDTYDAVQNKITALQTELDGNPGYSQDTRNNIQDSIDSLKKSLLTIGTQPVTEELITSYRYRLNIILADKQSHIDDIQQILAVFGGFLVFNGNKISLRMEKDTSVSYAFTDDNICKASDGRMDVKWETTSLADAPNQYVMKFYDPKNEYVGVKVQVNDFGNQRERGKVVSKEITLNGITSQSQALRLGRMYLAKTKMCYGVCTFSTGTFAMHLQPGDVITVTHGILANQPLRILQTSEDNGKWTLKCQQWNSSIYTDYLRQEITFGNYSVVPNAFSDVVPEAQSIVLSQNCYTLADGTTFTTVYGNIAIPQYIFYSSCDVYFSTDSGITYTYLMSTTTGEFTLRGAIPKSTYIFKAVVVNSAGRKSNGIVSNGIYITGKDSLPPDVSSVLVESLADGTRRFYWDYTYPDPNDIAGFMIKYNAGRVLNWDMGIAVTNGIIAASPYESQAFKSGIYTVMIKAVDRLNQESKNFAYAILNMGDQIVQNVIWTKDFAPEFAGKKVGCNIVDGKLQANETAAKFWTDDSAPFWADDKEWFWSEIFNGMEYLAEFSLEQHGLLSFDYGIEGTAKIFYHRKYPYSFWTNDSDPMWTDDSQLMWKEGPWIQYYNRVEAPAGDYELKVVIDSGHLRPSINKLTAIVDVPDIIETVNDLAVPSTGEVTIPITKTYIKIKNISVTIQETVGSTAAYARTSSKSNAAPKIKLYDKNYVLCPGLVDITVQGY